MIGNVLYGATVSAGQGRCSRVATAPVSDAPDSSAAVTAEGEG